MLRPDVADATASRCGGRRRMPRASAEPSAARWRAAGTDAHRQLGPDRAADGDVRSGASRRPPSMRCVTVEPPRRRPDDTAAGVIAPAGRHGAGGAGRRTARPADGREQRQRDRRSPGPGRRGGRRAGRTGRSPRRRRSGRSSRRRRPRRPSRPSSPRSMPSCVSVTDQPSAVRIVTRPPAPGHRPGERDDPARRGRDHLARRRRRRRCLDAGPPRTDEPGRTRTEAARGRRRARSRRRPGPTQTSATTSTSSNRRIAEPPSVRPGVVRDANVCSPP